MDGVNYLAVLAATVAAFLVSAVWYTLFGGADADRTVATAQQDPKIPPWKVLVELMRSLVVASVLAVLTTLLDISELTASIIFAVSLWIAFPAVLLTGSVTWEGVSWRLAAVHSGDWLVKLVVIATIIGLWR
jgi:Protein of unknown function (DUF1761)